jgi:hypothetical protein
MYNASIKILVTVISRGWRCSKLTGGADRPAAAAAAAVVVVVHVAAAPLCPDVSVGNPPEYPLPDTAAARYSGPKHVWKLEDGPIQSAMPLPEAYQEQRAWQEQRTAGRMGW